jgi:spoIIIJ-associated protein
VEQWGKAETILRAILEGLGLEAELQIEERGDAPYFDVKGKDLGLLIGRQGQTLDAVQSIINAVSARGNPEHRQIIVDAEGYRERQKRSVEDLAERMAQRAIAERGTIVLRPMGAYERKLVHLILKDNPEVETLSEGREPFRCVAIRYLEANSS